MKEKHEYGTLKNHVNTFDAYLGPEWAQASSLERLPPLKVLREGLVPNMNLKLQLPEWQRSARSDIGREEGRNGFKFPAFNINL